MRIDFDAPLAPVPVGDDAFLNAAQTLTREPPARIEAPSPSAPITRTGRTPSPESVAAAAMTVIAAVAYAAVSLYRHDHFGSTEDLATQTQTVWGYSRLEIIPNTIVGIPNLMGDHFHPVLMLLAPLFWIWNSAAVLLVAQAVLLAVAGVPVFLWARERLGALAALAMQAAYFVYWGVLAGVLFDFHHVVFAVAAISWALYAALTRRNVLLWAMVAVAMLTREDVPLTVIALGVYIVVAQRRIALGLFMMGLNTVWFGLLLGYIMPALAQAQYRHWTYGALGSGPLSAVLYVFTHPVQSVELLFVPLAKTKIWIGTFGNWLFLPVLSPITIVALPTFLERFWNDSPSFWTFHMQYSMLPAPILAFATIDTIARIRGRLQPRAWVRPAAAVAALTVLLVSTAGSFLIVEPLAEISTYVSDTTAADIQACLDVIPADASVAASQELMPHLATRRQIYRIPIEVSNHVYAPVASVPVDYIAIDLASGGSSDADMRDTVATAIAGDYGVVCDRELTLVLKRGGTVKTLPPVFQLWLAGGCRWRYCLPQG